MTSFFSAWLQKSTEIREHCSEALRGCCGITVVPLCVAPISREYIQDHSPHISMACFQIVVIGYGWNTVKCVSNRWRRFVRHSALIQGVVKFIFFPSIRYTEYEDWFALLFFVFLRWKLCNMEQLQTQILTKHFQFFWSKVTDATETTSFFLFFFFYRRVRSNLLGDYLLRHWNWGRLLVFKIYWEHENQKANVSLRWTQCLLEGRKGTELKNDFP